VKPWCLIKSGRGLPHSKTLRDWLGAATSEGLGVRQSSAAFFLLATFLSGCLPTTDEKPFRSQFFDRVEIIGHRGAGIGELNKPRSVAVDREDNLYVVDMTGRVQKFSPRGQFLLSWQMPQTDKGKPKGMCRDKDGNIVVLEPHYSRVNHYTPQGSLMAQWGTHGTNVGELAFPRSVAVNSRGNIFVSEYGLTERVQCFSGEKKELLFGFGSGGDGNGQFNRAEGLGIDSRDRVYVADSCNHRIQIFSSEGKWLASYGRPGNGPGELSYPYDVRVDAAGFQYVCEFGNSRIQIFDRQNKVVEILGGAGAARGGFSNPWSIALDSQGNLYVADAGNHRVQKFLRRKEIAATPSPRPSSPGGEREKGHGGHEQTADNNTHRFRQKRQRTAALQNLRSFGRLDGSRSVMECGSPLPLFLTATR